MAKKKPAPNTVPVETIRHQDQRTNIPTAEQSPMVDEAAPVVRYPRDPSLDPQLVWKTKDEQDGKDLEVVAVPIYIQEKIHPRALIDDLRRQARSDQPRQAELFSAFENLDASKRLEFYQHSQRWANRLILGDSLLVMTSLAEKERLKGQVQMIFMDPPYGIKFGSNWQVSTRKRDVKDAKIDDLTRQPEQIKAFRDTWQLGIHSYLTYLRDRLTVARELLTESGSIFVQIGDENVHLVRCLLDEVFGGENFICSISFATTTGFESKFLGRAGDRLLWYGKDRTYTKYRELYQDTPRPIGGSGYRWISLPDGSTRSLTSREIAGEEEIPATASLYVPDNIISQGAASQDQTFVFRSKQYHPGPNSHWKARFPEGMNKLGYADRLHASANSLRFIRFANDFPYRVRNNVWTDTQTGQFTDDKIYAVQTNTKVLERCLLMTTDPGDLVLDPTCGSGTTAYVAEQWGRRWITIDSSRVALTLARTRLMTARYPYYFLADSPEGRHKEAALTGQVPDVNAPPTTHDIRRGFVYKRVPHVTLKSIANNPDIKEGMTREQIDAAIRRHADTETLFDQPYEDKSILRVCGPFTVESLSPHRVLPGDLGPATASETATPGNFVQTILDNLRKSGVQNTKKGERLTFDRLDVCSQPPFQFHGEYTDQAGLSRRVAVCLGPEFGTVGPELIQHAARTAHRGLGYDLLLVCGFAFDPHVAEESILVEKQMGKIRVLLVRMNPDLAMGDELLKKTGSGNLFMVFGEPDVELKRLPDGRYVMKVLGLDVFDPTTGELRSSSTDDIACWFLDTDYDEESFFVRHAYFCGAGEAYEKLQRALKAEIDEGEWQKLYATESMPFDKPTTGKIAVKVINHYGDEVLKVYGV